MSGWRHPTLGHAIDRSKPVAFTFDGKTINGFHGDTIASALLASGIRVVARSFKYHRPRGIWGFGNEEPNALFDVTINGRTTPNLRATTMPIQPGMEIRSVNADPTSERDRYALIDRLHRFLPAGFYYKTFMAFGWKKWEPMIRRMAGLGTLDKDNAPPADCPQVNAACDLLIVGAGPAGLAAARGAALSGRKVWLVDDAAEPGGSLRWRGGEINGSEWREFVQQSCDLILNAGGRVLSNTTLWGAFDHGLFAAWQRREENPDVHWRIRANEVIVATGAIERPMIFANNDLPGIMSSEAALAHLNIHGAVVGRKIIVATANDLSYPVAEALLSAGAEVTIADLRADAPQHDDIEQIIGAKLTAAKGRKQITAAVINSKIMEVDTLLVSGGYTPSVHLWCQAGGKLNWNNQLDALIPRPGTANMNVVGAANGTYDLDHALLEGHKASSSTNDAPQASAPTETTMNSVRPNPALPGRQWVDYQNDVTLKDIELAANEGFTSVEHLKRYTTLGMATDQGRTSNFSGLAAMAAITERTIPETGTTTFRPPFQPVPFPVIAGRRRGELFNPLKRLHLEVGHRAQGAQFREYGGWLRPSVYGDDAETKLAQEEALAARTTVGIFDASPLGKLEVMGPGAAELMDFTNYVRMSTLKSGRVRYGFMLAESGVVFDDGVVLRLDENRYIVSASSSHVTGARFRLEDARQDRIGRSRVYIHDLTSAWVTLTVSGPHADALIKDAGIELPALTHMSVVETRLDHHALRIARISFTGDQSFELSVPANHGEALRTRLNKALEKHNGRWVGLEAVMILRAEKGYILVGKDTDGLTMPHDLGWFSPRQDRDDEYLGKRSLFTPAACSEKRKQLVGVAIEGDEPLAAGSHFVPIETERRSLGYITSSYFSPVLNKPIALGLLEEGHSLIGKTIGCFNNGEVRIGNVTPACVFDPKGECLNG